MICRILPALTLLLSSFPLEGQAPAPRDYRGMNYLPATTRALDNATALLPYDNPNGLTGSYSQGQIDQELQYIASHGLNTVRVFPSFYGYLVDRVAYMNSLRDLASSCTRHGLYITYVVWNVVALSAPPYAGGPPEVWQDLQGTDPHAATNAVLYQSLMDRNQAMSQLFGHLVPPWAPHHYSIHAEPGHELFQNHGGDPLNWPNDLKPRVDAYLDAVATFFATDPIGQAAFASYDLLNEPNTLGPMHETAYLEFIRYTKMRLDQNHPGATCTVGWATSDPMLEQTDQRLRTQFGVEQTYLSSHSYARPERFEEICADRARYAATQSKDFVLSEFHRVDITSGVLEYQLSSLVRHGLGGQAWGLIQSNGWLPGPTPGVPIDGIAVPLDPGTPTGSITFLEINRQDADALRRYGAGTLTPRPFTRIVLRDSIGQQPQSLTPGSYTLDIESTLTNSPVFLANGFEPNSVTSCDLDPFSNHCLPLRALGPFYASPAQSIQFLGFTNATGSLATPLPLQIPQVARGRAYGATALVGLYPTWLPELNTAELTRLAIFPVL